MKIFQIGFNFCGLKFITKFCRDHGLRVVSGANGQLAIRMHDNYSHSRPLLHGLEHFDYYSDMENVDQNIRCYLTYVEDLDRQYPNSKFILNTTDDITGWVERRLAHPRYLERCMKAQEIHSQEEMIQRWKDEWYQHHRNMRTYFQGREGTQFFEYCFIRHHPLFLYTFLNPGVNAMTYFEWIYNSRLKARMHDRPPLMNGNGSSSLESVAIYCPLLPDRRDYMKKLLERFQNVQYFDAVTPRDLCKKDYQMLSTTYMMSPRVTPCSLGNYCADHHSLYHKFTKLCVHLSYMSCLRHAIEDGTKEYVLIFEDDIYFDVSNEHFDDHIAEFMNSEYDVVYLGFCCCRNGDTVVQDYPDKKSLLVPLPINQTILCKHAILYKVSYIKTLLPHLLPLTVFSDIQLNHANIYLRGRVAMARTPIVFQDRETFQSCNENGSKTGPLPLYSSGKQV